MIDGAAIKCSQLVFHFSQAYCSIKNQKHGNNNQTQQSRPHFLFGVEFALGIRRANTLPSFSFLPPSTGFINKFLTFTIRTDFQKCLLLELQHKSSRFPESLFALVIRRECHPLLENQPSCPLMLRSSFLESTIGGNRRIILLLCFKPFLKISEVKMNR